jgi:predicted  nucleic acid-binding Zn-ribbon protein
MPVKLTSTEIRHRILATHGTNSIYSFPDLAEVKDREDDVTLMCQKHGASRMKVKSILTHGSGCNECGVRKARKYDNRIFEEKARAIHGDKYDYSQVDYQRSYEKVTIVCPEHGSWSIRPHNHLSNRAGCPRCGARQGVINSTPSKSRNLKSSRIITVDGFDFHTDSSAERKVLPDLCREYGADSVRDQDHVPLISYKFLGERKLYRPDFCIPSANILVEVKSPFTIGLMASCPDRKLTPDGTFEQVRAKALAAIYEGYNYRTFVVSRGKSPIELPYNWHDRFKSPEQLKHYMESKI